eukprot:4271426-Pyramimonas_sp.AAC.1
MTPKPPPGGDRPITPTPGPFRPWSILRKQPVTTWERQKAGFWDSAVKGSRPLRAAVLRQLK